MSQWGVVAQMPMQHEVGFPKWSSFAQCLLHEGKYLSLQLQMADAVEDKCVS